MDGGFFQNNIWLGGLECGKIKSLLLSKKGEGEFIGSRIAGAVRLN